MRPAATSSSASLAAADHPRTDAAGRRHACQSEPGGIAARRRTAGSTPTSRAARSTGRTPPSTTSTVGSSPSSPTGSPSPSARSGRSVASGDHSANSPPAGTRSEGMNVSCGWVTRSPPASVVPCGARWTASAARGSRPSYGNAADARSDGHPRGPFGATLVGRRGPRAGGATRAHEAPAVGTAHGPANPGTVPSPTSEHRTVTDPPTRSPATPNLRYRPAPTLPPQPGGLP
jgi:hypothetical protein